MVCKDVRRHSVGLSPGYIQTVQDRLLAWHCTNAREFPWRNTREPYATLVAEKLLQQTAATQRVADAYLALMRRCPTPAMLAATPLAALQAMLAPLGLLYRARELQQMGFALEECWHGEVPMSLRDLKELPGVGDYIARAVLSFAYGQDVPVVDTNIARYLYRLRGLPGQVPKNPARSSALLDLAARFVPSGRSRSYNLGLIDLCAAICTPRQPQHTKCPLLAVCVCGQAGVGLDGAQPGALD